MIRKLLTAAVVVASLTIVRAAGPGSTTTRRTRSAITPLRSSRTPSSTAEEVRAGTKDAEAAAEEIQDDVNELTNETIDAAKDANIPDEAREQLEAAQDQMNAAADGN